jgi:hypothetical protein
MIKRIIIVMLCMVPLAAFAEPPGRNGSGNGKDRRPPFKRPTTKPSDDPKEFEKALLFFESMSPSRYQAYQSLDDERKHIFRERIMAFYYVNQWVNRENGDEMRLVRQRLLRAEDKVFEVRWNILQAGGPKKATEQELAELREAVGQLVTVQQQERALRLERFKKFVKQEEESLANILANPNEEIEKRYRDELEGRGVGLFDHPRRHDGPGGGPGGGGSSGRDDKDRDKDRDKDKSRNDK